MPRDYVGELIREDEKREAEEQLEALLLQGLASDESEMTREDWKDIREQALSQVKTRRMTR